jgi:exopolysaccharide production protein ExoQ
MLSTAVPPYRASVLAPSTSALSLTITYAVLLPLLFFAARGSFSFEYQDLNNGTVGAYGGLAIPASGSGSLTHTAEMLGIYGLAVLVMLPMWKQILQTCRENKLVFALPILALMSTIWSQEPTRTAAFAILALINTLFAVYLSRRFPPVQQMEIFLLAGTVLAVASLLVVAFLPQAGIDHKNAAIGWQGVFPHKNICAMVMVSFLLPALSARFTGSFGQIRRVFYLLLLTALIAGTTSRTGWIAGVLCIFCVYLLNLLRRFRQIERGLVFLSLPVAIGGLIWIVILNASDLLALLGKNSTLTGRTVIWAAALMSIVKRPLLGFGYSAFWIGFKGEAVNLALATGYAGLGNAENGVLQLWLEVGLVGVALLFLMLMRTCKNAATCFRVDSPGYVIWYMSLLFLALLALVDGDKFMVPHAIEWTMYIVADVGLAMEAKRLRVLQTA